MTIVVQLFREYRQAGHSIEEIFKQLNKRLTEKEDIFEYHCAKSRFKNLLNVRQLKYDVAHITGDVHYLFFALRPHSTIITVHDIGHLYSLKSPLKRFLFEQIWYRVPLSRARIVTTISNFSKDQIVSRLRISPERIRVIHNPAPTETFQPAASQEIRGKLKILQIGAAPNKNFERLFEACKGLDVELILLGNYSDSVKQKLQQDRIAARFVSTASYEDVARMYSESDMVYFASLYEGFGMPIVEAQLVGRPVITASVASMPEVAGLGAHYVDPTSVQDIRHAILKISTDASYRLTLIEEGKRNVTRFSLDRIASHYASVYSECGAKP